MYHVKLLYGNQNVWFQENEQNGTTLSPILKYTKYPKAPQLNLGEGRMDYLMNGITDQSF